MSVPIKGINQFFTDIDYPFEIVDFQILEPEYKSGNISFIETVIVSLICRNLNPMYILEFGTFNGRTTTNISANTSEEAKIITVDLPFTEADNTVYPLVGSKETDEHDELGYIGRKNKLYLKHDPIYRDKITQLWIDSAKFPVKKYPAYFDLIFIDASHSYKNVLNDTHIALHCIKDQGLILWHDYNGWPGVTQALNEFYIHLVDDYKKQMCHIKDTSLVIYKHKNPSP